MASSENQSLQISLIIFVILTIILSVTSFLFFRGWSDAANRSQADSDAAGQAQNGLRAAEQDVQKLLTLQGVETSGSRTQDIQAAEEAFEADKRVALDTFGAELQSYSDGISILTTTIRDISARLAAEEEKVRRLTLQHEAREDIKQKQIDQFSTEAQTARQELETEQTKFEQDRRQLEQDKSELAQQRTELQTQLTEAVETHQQEMETAGNEINSLRALAESRLSTIDELTNEEFEVADGEIRIVSQRRGVVWINLGSADFLRPQVTFSVFGSDATNVSRMTRKGAIEIIDVRDDHLAEARIIEDNIFDPLIPGDKIYTPLWHPGRQDHFALAGWMDLDGDGQSDRRLVRDLILLTGGVIDAELDDEGNESGQITYNTRFLVVGEPREEINEKLGQLQSRASELGVRPMSVDKLLDLAGWKQGNRVLRFRRSGSGRSGRTPDGASTEEPGRSPFRPRPPVAAGGFRIR